MKGWVVKYFLIILSLAFLFSGDIKKTFSYIVEEDYEFEELSEQKDKKRPNKILDTLNADIVALVSDYNFIPIRHVFFSDSFLILNSNFLKPCDSRAPPTISEV